MAYTAEKRIENGNPVLYVDGKKCTPMIYALSDLPASNPLTAQAQKNIASFARQGIHLVNTDVSLYKGWHKKGEYDASFLQGDLHAIVSVNPEAHIILRLHVNAPYWWMRDHPEELCIFAKGDVPYVDCGEYERLIKGDEDNDMRVSLASELWLHDAGEQVRALLGAVMDTEDGSHIVGIQIAGGVYGEWHQWGFTYEPDYGACMTAYFRRYLREIYPDEDALRCAWNDPTASFDTAVPAPPALRGHTEPGGYRHPAKDRYVIDSLTAQMRCAPDAILYFARLIRECVTRPILIGTFYGYYDSWDSTYLSGHLDVKRLTESGAVDYFSAPFRYDRGMRGVHGVTEARGLLESARLNGLLWLTEMDNPPIGSTEHIGGDPARLSENIAILRKNVLQPLTRGMGMWYCDHRLVLDLGFGCSIYRKKRLVGSSRITP